jgi:hypothetical protein
MYIGGVLIPKDLRDSLRQDARYIQISRFWDVLQATIIDESAKLALIQATNYEHVLSAKMLYHYQHVFKNMLLALVKE